MGNSAVERQFMMLPIPRLPIHKAWALRIIQHASTRLEILRLFRQKRDFPGAHMHNAPSARNWPIAIRDHCEQPFVRVVFLTLKERQLENLGLTQIKLAQQIDHAARDADGIRVDVYHARCRSVWLQGIERVAEYVFRLQPGREGLILVP